MRLKGKVFKFGNDINTDEIIPARYLDTSDPAELAEHCMEDADKNFIKKMKEGDVIVAGENFGCGSSREHAPVAIKAAGVSCVIAKSFARIFYRNAINIGLPIFTSIEAAETLKQGDRVVVSVKKGEISKAGQKKVFKSEVYPDFIRDIIEKGGLMEIAKEKIPAKDKIKPGDKVKAEVKPKAKAKPKAVKKVRKKAKPKAKPGKTAKKKAKKRTVKSKK